VNAETGTATGTRERSESPRGGGVARAGGATVSRARGDGDEHVRVDFVQGQRKGGGFVGVDRAEER
jgi:hypothetical protein